MSVIRLFGRIFYYVTLVLKQEITIKTMCSNLNLETPKNLIYCKTMGQERYCHRTSRLLNC